MKLALLSDLQSNTASQAVSYLFSVFNTHVSIGYLASEHEPNKHYFQQTQGFYTQFNGQMSCYVDLQQGYSDEKFNTLCQADVIHLAGGDTFGFLADLQRRDKLNQLRAFARKGGIIVGVSAGAMLLTPNIMSAFLCGDENSAMLDDFSALALLPYQFVPHADFSQNGVDLSVAASRLFNHDDLVRYPLIFCSDGDAVVYQNNHVIGFGAPLLFDGISVLSLV
ncbi:Type 1 glutamine amidotransferase-like domain-containing protein [Shewanella psychrotolerans]|uniref:Type 1 glutamine amidotransferase-like domain-containing protein n=1 Tax=Shewanella psychrotolerans TaxID=2864206 RepID=UPI001C654EB8|nr:Type 1 glutamine amidotransferase-like domain-containing protein [Shewanella psychrotolerans]QYK02913.1 Type 1 glutamine amidotransferase-like domain-containing protein [Shewanella psychrotolerans]